jgi:hypothetical protein
MIWGHIMQPCPGRDRQCLGCLRKPLKKNSGLKNTFHLKDIYKIKNYQGNPVIEPNDRNGLTKNSELMMFQIQSISKERLVRKIGEISSNELETALETLDDLMRL